MEGFIFPRCTLSDLLPRVHSALSIFMDWSGDEDKALMSQSTLRRSLACKHTYNSVTLGGHFMSKLQPLLMSLEYRSAVWHKWTACAAIFYCGFKTCFFPLRFLCEFLKCKTVSRITKARTHYLSHHDKKSLWHIFLTGSELMYAGCDVLNVLPGVYCVHTQNLNVKVPGTKAQVCNFKNCLEFSFPPWMFPKVSSFIAESRLWSTWGFVGLNLLSRAFETGKVWVIWVTFGTNKE